MVARCRPESHHPTAQPPQTPGGNTTESSTTDNYHLVISKIPGEICRQQSQKEARWRIFERVTRLPTSLLRRTNTPSEQHGKAEGGGILTAAISQLRQLSPDLQSGLGVPPRNPPLLLVHAGLVAELGGVPHRGHELHLPIKKRQDKTFNGYQTTTLPKHSLPVEPCRTTTVQ